MVEETVCLFVASVVLWLFDRIGDLILTVKVERSMTRIVQNEK